MRLIFQKNSGFTLIELSIVLVIIGLIVGGVLVGRDLITAAGVRAQISQIEKFQQAVNTFKGKYGGLPGDLANPEATRFGFVARGTQRGQGDGDGNIEGTNGGGATQDGTHYQGIGETSVFWVDLSTAKLIDGSFITATQTSWTGEITGTGLDLYLPSAKIGRGNYLYVWNGGDIDYNISNSANTGINYFGMTPVTRLNGPSSGQMGASGAGLSVKEAMSIDAKIDDGFPQTGNVRAAAIPGGSVVQWAIGNWGVNGAGAPDMRATAGTSETCYDNNNIADAVQRYSLGQNNGGGINCALSFKFQ